MDLRELFIHPVISRKLCKLISFDDAINIQQVLGPKQKVTCTFKIIDGTNHCYNLRGVNSETIRVYRLIQGQDAEKIFLNAARKDHFEIIRLLLKIGMNVNVFTETGNTALTLASAEGNFEIVQILLDHRADPNIFAASGYPALCHAAMHDDPKILKILLQSGANPNISGAFGNTALIWAVRFDYIENIKILLEAGANINAVNVRNKSALFWACLNENIEIIRLLLEKGADIHDVLRFNLIDLISSRNIQEILELLESYIN